MVDYLSLTVSCDIESFTGQLDILLQLVLICIAPILMAFIFIFLLVNSHLLLTLADQSSKEHNHSSLGGRTAITASGIAAIVALAFIIVFKTNKRRASTEGFCHFSLEGLRCFSIDEILSATENFSPACYIRHRGFGDLYAGLIDEGRRAVAIKRVPFEFFNEVKALSKLRHDNLVSLIGYCNESLDIIVLVYDHMLLGTLADNLYINTHLSWEKRLRICIGAARGLDYLHTSTDHGVTLGDLNSSSILLNELCMPKILDFRLSKLEELEAARKTDVYSFGIVLLEVLHGKPFSNSRDQEKQLELIMNDSSLTGDGDIDQIVDPRLHREISPQCLIDYLVMSAKCLDDDPMKRPTMALVVAWLEHLLDVHVSRESNSRIVPDGGSVIPPEAPIIVPKPNTSGAPSVAVMPNILEAGQGSTEPETSETNSGNSSSEPSQRNKEPMFSDELSQCFSMSKFAAATENFSNKYSIHQGACRIYKGPYPSDGKDPTYIIYRGMYTSTDNSKLKEVSHLSHPNLASMVGYCCSDIETIVGYKNESYHLLIDKLQFYNLSWLERLDICIGAAEALRYIHTAKIYHGGISPVTILITKSGCAKLITFGSVLSDWFVQRPVFPVNSRRGLVTDSTHDFLPPDNADLAKPTEKTDVYLFGLLLLIIFSGKKIDYSNGYPFRLPVMVYKAIKGKALHQITDLNLADVEEECLNVFLEVAFCCFSPEQVDWPSMDTVLERLSRAQDQRR